MVKLIDVDPDEINNVRQGHRGRVSYPIMKMFLESGKVLVKIDRTGMQQSLQSLSSSLNAYIRNHELPVKMFMRAGEVYLMRTDTDDAGVAEPKKVDDFYKTRQPVGVAPQELLDKFDEIPEVDGTEVDRRFLEEKDQVTK